MPQPLFLSTAEELEAGAKQATVSQSAEVSLDHASCEASATSTGALKTILTEKHRTKTHEVAAAGSVCA